MLKNANHEYFPRYLTEIRKKKKKKRGRKERDYTIEKKVSVRVGMAN